MRARTETNSSQKVWQAYLRRAARLTERGLRRHQVRFYDDQLVEELRAVFWCGVPGSIRLLSRQLTRGNCTTGALLMAQALMNAGYHVRVLDLEIDGLRLKPRTDTERAPSVRDDYRQQSLHRVVETTLGGRRPLIIDTTLGLVFDKRLYWKIDHPTVVRIDEEPTIRKILQMAGDFERPSSRADCCEALKLVLERVESGYGAEAERYSLVEQGRRLQHEVDRWRRIIYYDGLPIWAKSAS